MGNGDAAMPLETAETHMSWLLFTPDRAYKRLKPVAMPFIDHTDTATRLASIDRELELNRAISPDVYLGTADVHENGELVDRLLVMRRLPADRRLATLAGRPGFDAHLRAVAKEVARLHASRPPITDAPMAEHASIAENWRDNIAVLRDHVGPVVAADAVDHLEELVERYLHHREPLFRERIGAGWIRDGHGDLIADDIYCLDDGPRIIDCLAFNDRWRVGDELRPCHRCRGATSSRRRSRPGTVAAARWRARCAWC